MACKLSAKCSAFLRYVSTRQFLVFTLLPFLMAFGVSVEVYMLSYKREQKEANTHYDAAAAEALLAMRMSWNLTVMYPENLISVLAGAGSVLTPIEFERYNFGAAFFNKALTITKMIYVEQVLNSTRAAWEASTGLRIIEIADWYGSWTVNQSVRPWKHKVYYPIRHISPPQPDVLGLDLYPDPYNGALMKGCILDPVPHVSPPFMFRSVPQTIEFRLGLTVFQPLYETVDGVRTVEYTDNMIGGLITCILIKPMLENILQRIIMTELDVFLFDVSDGFPVYMAHYESPPDASRPRYTMAQMKTIRPEDITGDFVTPFTSSWDVHAYSRTFRIMVRAREGRFTKNYLTVLPVVLLLISIGVKLVDKTFAVVEKKFYYLAKHGHHHPPAEAHDAKTAHVANATNTPPFTPRTVDGADLDRVSVSNSSVMYAETIHWKGAC